MTCRSPVAYQSEIALLSDGTTTIDLYSAKIRAQVKGTQLPPPPSQPQWLSNPFRDGDELSAFRYGNRIITIDCYLKGSTVAGLRDVVRDVHRLLNDARQRLLLGYGARVYLEYQWGVTPGASVYYDILHGELALPPDFSWGMMWHSHTLINVRLTLICVPFGRYTDQDYAQQTIENEQDGANLNYFDIATDATYGDVPARAYIKIAQANATGSKKIWVAKRSGSRRTDNLWRQGESEDSTTDIIGAPHTIAFADIGNAAQSGLAFQRVRATTVGAINQQTLVARVNYDITTPPRGTYRVLAMVKATSTYAGVYYPSFSFGMGWEYGARTKTPAFASDEFYGVSAADTWEIIDLGLLKIPPIAESDIAGNTDFQLRLFQASGIGAALPSGETHDWCCDYIFLLPIDEGVAIVNDVAAADVLALDGITDPPGVFILDGADEIQNTPDYVGKPLDLGRESTRYYFLRDDVKGVIFTVDVKYRPQFLIA